MIINTGMRTDIPAFYHEWLINRIKEGFVLVRNPYNPSQVTRYSLSPEVVDLIAFCTKNPAPMLPHMDVLKPYGQYWFVTITPYGKDIEPNVPDKQKVMEDFKRLSDTISVDNVGWRYDPIFVDDKHDLDWHINQFEQMTWKDILGYGCQPVLDEKSKNKKYIQVKTTIVTVDEKPFYDGDVLLKDVMISFQPERPKLKVNYDIVVPDEDCLVFDTFNFKLAVINELMYNQEVLKPYFDIYDYMAFKKAHWNLETDKNVRAVVNYFKELPIPVRLADYVTEINMDGSDEVYMNIAPEWDGRDERFDFNSLTETEIKQFKNLKKILIFGNDKDATKLRKTCDPLGIEVEPLATLE